MNLISCHASLLCVCLLWCCSLDAQDSLNITQLSSLYDYWESAIDVEIDGQVLLRGDSTTADRLTANWGTSQQMKHIEVWTHFVRHSVIGAKRHVLKCILVHNGFQSISCWIAAITLPYFCFSFSFLFHFYSAHIASQYGTFLSFYTPLLHCFIGVFSVCPCLFVSFC